MKRPHTASGADRAIWIAHEYLKSKVMFSTNGLPLVITGGTVPFEVSVSSGMTRLEAELALRMLVTMGHARKRKDGRYFYLENREAETALAITDLLQKESKQ